MATPDAPRRRTGLIIGKFMPPHAGHVHLVDRARAASERLALILFSKPAEPIPGDLRKAWLHELFPDVDIIHVTTEGQVDYASPDAWSFWVSMIRGALPSAIRPDLVFSSEPYGEELARRLNAQHVAVDPDRSAVPVSASQIRANPMQHWRFIPAPVRPYFVRRVVLLGAESTWKTTLAHALADRFDTRYTGEYAREYLEGRSEPLVKADMLVIARRQLALEDRLAREATRVLICDTNLLATYLWYERYWGAGADEIAELHRGHHYDLALVSAVAGTPWVDDGLRDSPHLRQWFEARYVEELERAGTPYITLQGQFEERLETAAKAVAKLVEG